MASSRRRRLDTCSRSGSRESNLRWHSTSSRTGASRPVTSNPKRTSSDPRIQKDGTVMGTTIATDRKMRVEEILAAFGIKAGGTVSGVAHGGSFKDDAPGAPIETRNPSTGEVLARVGTATPDDCRHARAEADDAVMQWRLRPPPRPRAVGARAG